MNLDMKFMRDLTNNRKSNSISTRLEGNTSVKMCIRDRPYRMYDLLKSISVFMDEAAENKARI